MGSRATQQCRASTFLASAWPSRVRRDSGRRCRPPTCSCVPPPFIVLTLFISFTEPDTSFLSLTLSSTRTWASSTTSRNCWAALIASHKICTCCSQARRQNLPAGGTKTRRGNIFKIQYWVYAATRGPNVKWGAPIPNGGPGTTEPPLATALAVRRRPDQGQRSNDYYLIMDGVRWRRFRQWFRRCWNQFQREQIL